jgi:hypothetical protein
LGTSLIGGLLAAGQLFPASDERVKENMEPVGRTFDGQNIYKYNYIGEPQTHLGLSAQEVEKRHPHAVHKTLGDIRTVDYDAATQPAADRGHFDLGGEVGWMGGGVHPAEDRSIMLSLAALIRFMALIFHILISRLVDRQNR